MTATVSCGMPTDSPEEMGGAILIVGELEIKKSVFAENMAADGGLAIKM